jgi:CubicO group peptidase (beta-lactamase class C family)
MRLRNEGAIELNDLIGAHITELSDLPVTIGQLLSHTSGLRAETPGPWWERVPGMTFSELVATALRAEDLLWRPGRRFHYSNPGYAVLGELIARKRSVPFADAVHNELLVPLGMGRTTFRPVAPYVEGLAVHPHVDAVLHEPEHDAVAMAPAGQLWSTIEDLGRWSEVLAGQRPEIICPEATAEMAEPIGFVDVPGEPWTSAYGLGLQILNQAGQRRYGHSGAMPGHWGMIVVDQASKDAVVGFANRTYGGLRGAFFGELLSLLASEHPRPRDPFRPGISSADAQVIDLLGTWYWGPAEYRLDLDNDGHLRLKGVPSGRDCRFQPNGDGSYVGESGYFHGELLEAHRRDDGSAAYLDIASYIFTRSPYDPAAPVPGGVHERGWEAY